MNKNCIRKSFVFTVLFAVGAVCTAKEISIGGKNGWSQLKIEENVTRGKGRFGYESIELATNSFVFDDYTDLLIDFENPSNPIASGAYRIVENNLKTSDSALMERTAGLSRNLGGLHLEGLPGSFFGSQGLRGSFSIEFWLFPSIAENGETILNWESSKNENGILVYQLLNCAFENGHLEWHLSNIFDSSGFYDGFYDEIYLRGTTTIIPDSWSYHALSYDADNGCLEYLVNGITEAIYYITSNGRDNGEVALVTLGAPSDLELCTEYTGKIDEIRVLRRPYSPPDYQSAENAGALGRMIYSPYGGRFVTQPVIVSNGSRLESFSAEISEPAETAVSFYVRSGDNFFDWTESKPEWKPVEPGEPVPEITGLYFQVACDLYPDGNGSKTPNVTEIRLSFEELPVPLPPFTVRAKAGNGCVTLTWSYSVDETVGGYYIYYGTRPGEYLGRIAAEGESPIRVENTTSFTLTGLENGKIYYFAVAAWSALDDRIVGEASREVFARPLERLGK